MRITKKVTGVYNGYLWFHLEGETGSTYWDNILCYDDFITMGFIVQDYDDFIYQKDEDDTIPINVRIFLFF